MKKLNLAILAIIALFIDAFLVNWNWQMGVIKSIPDAIEWFLALFLVTFGGVLIYGKIHAVRRRGELDRIDKGQCANCGGGLGPRYWKCGRHRDVEVFCSEHCYYEHMSNAHRQSQ